VVATLAAGIPSDDLVADIQRGLSALALDEGGKRREAET
jgi:hypothetical protein